MRIEIEPINTDRRINVPGWEAGFRDFLDKEGREIYKYFDEVSKAFTNHEVVITQKRIKKSGGDLETIVGVLDPGDGNKIFSYVNWGTAPRMIYPVNAKMLVFRPRYRRATHPGSIVITPPWVKEGPFVRLGSVFNPGIEERRFDMLIQFLMQGDVEYQARRSVKNVAKKMWI
jgi:hypothetical protein